MSERRSVELTDFEWSRVYLALGNMVDATTTDEQEDFFGGKQGAAAARRAIKKMRMQLAQEPTDAE